MIPRRRKVEFTQLGVKYSPRYTCGQNRSFRLMHPQEFALNTQNHCAILTFLR